MSAGGTLFMNDETKIETYSGFYRSQAEDRFRVDATHAAAQGWKPISQWWNGTQLSVTYARPDGHRPPMPPPAHSPAQAPSPTPLVGSDRSVQRAPASTARISRRRIVELARLAAVAAPIAVAWMVAMTGIRMVTGIGITTPVPTNPVSALPSGMTTWPGDPSLAWTWSDGTAAGCQPSGVWCQGIEVVAEGGCPGALYVVVAVLDASNHIIGHADDVVEGLNAGVRTDLRFTSTSSRATSTRPWAMDCF
jgi:hypothetical protein